MDGVLLCFDVQPGALRVQVLGQGGKQEHPQVPRLRGGYLIRGRGQTPGQGEGRLPAQKAQLGVMQGLPG